MVACLRPFYVASIFCSAMIVLGVFASSASSDGALTLPDAVNRALKYAPALAAASANSDLSSARVDEALAPLFPSVSANAEYSQSPGYSQVITNRGLTTSQLGLDYTAFDGGRRQALVRAARYAAQAATLGIASARAQVVFDTTLAFFDLTRARDAQQELAANLNRLEGYVAIVEALRQSGRVIANDVLRIRAAKDSAELALAAATQEIHHASIVLGSIIGEQGDSDIEVTQSSGLPIPSKGDLMQTPTLRAVEHQVVAAQFAVKAAEAERMPTFKLGLTAGWLGIDPSSTFDQHLGASYGGMVTVPIFQGGLIRSHIDQARAGVNVARAEEDQIRLALNRDLADAYDRYNGAVKLLDIIASSQATADDAFALDWTRFLGGGNVALLEVLDAYQQAENLRLARSAQTFVARQASAQTSLLLGIDRQ